MKTFSAMKTIKIYQDIQTHQKSKQK